MQLMKAHQMSVKIYLQLKPVFIQEVLRKSNSCGTIKTLIILLISEEVMDLWKNFLMVMKVIIAIGKFQYFYLPF